MAIDFSLSDVDKDLRARARAAFAPLRAGAKQPAEGQRADPVRDVWDALAAWGFFGCIIPPAYGAREPAALRAGANLGHHPRARGSVP